MVDDFFSVLTHELHATERNGQWICKCPAHDDSHPSLWLTQKDGKTLLHCLAGCSQQDVIAALRARGLWKQDSGMAPVAGLPPLPPGIPYFYPPHAVLKKQGKTPSLDNQKTYTKHWVYRDAAAKIVGHVVRYDGHDKKDVIPFFKKWPGGNWRSGHELSSGRSLYRLDSLPHGEHSKPCFIVEGEKCADGLAAILGDTALVVAWPGGAKSIKKVDWSPLSNFAWVILWPDYDLAGFRAMRDICKLLRELPQPPNRISLVSLAALGIPVLGVGADCIDLLSSNPNLSLEALLTPTALLDAEASKIEAVYRQLAPADVVVGEDQPPPDVEGTPNPDAPIIHALTDTGNGARFAEKQRHLCRFSPEVGWLHYNGSFWETDTRNSALSLARSTVETIREDGRHLKGDERKAIFKWWHQSQNFSRLKAMLEVAKSYPGITMPLDAFDSDPFQLCCLNGTLDLRTGKLSKHSAENLITRHVPVAFDKKATCPLWLQFLDRIMAGNTGIIDYLRRAIGYSLTGSCAEQVMFIMWGSGSNGKSVFMETIKKIWGTYALTTPTDLLLLDNHGGAASGSNSIARLKGARLVLGSEIPPGARLNESRVKEMTGSDTISARFLYAEFFDFIPQFKLWVRANNRPQISGMDHGIWRRIQCIPFTVAIADQDKDKMLGEKLAAELPGIFNWAVSGCLDWQESGLCVPAEVLTATKTYHKDMDIIGEWLDDCCVIDKEAEIQSVLLYNSLQLWMKTMGEKPWSHRAFGLNLRERGFMRVRRKEARYYQGLRLKPEVEMKTPVAEPAQQEMDKYNIF